MNDELKGDLVKAMIVAQTRGEMYVVEHLKDRLIAAMAWHPEVPFVFEGKTYTRVYDEKRGRCHLEVK